MAIEKYTIADGSVRYRATAYINGQRSRKRGFKTKREAKKWIATVQVIGAEPPSTAFDEIAYDWLENTYRETVIPSTFNKTKVVVRHAVEFFGSTDINAITIDDAQSLATSWSYEYVNFRSMISYVSKIFKWAKRKKLVRENPFDYIDTPKAHKNSKPPKDLWTLEELDRFMQACKSHKQQAVYPLFRLLIYSGIRRQEAMGLHWSDINGNMINIRTGITFDYDNHEIEGATKTDDSTREIAIDSETLNALEEWRTFCPSITRVFPFQIQRPYKWMQQIIQEQNLPAFSPHMLRHLHCTILITAGVQFKDVQERLGHADINTTLKYYAHANKDKSIASKQFTSYIEDNT